MTPAPSLEHSDPSPPATATAQALARILEQLRDRAWLAELVERGAQELAAPAPARAEECRVEYCKVKPNRDITIALAARLRGLDGEGAQPRRFSCTIYPDLQQARGKLIAEEAQPIDESLRRRLAGEGYARVRALLDAPAAIVRPFPLDPSLPGLAGATDAAQVTPILESRLGAGAIRSLSFDILHYKPGRSCMVRYAAGCGDGHARRVYGKAYRDDEGAEGDRVLRAAWGASGAGAGPWRVARPLGWVAPLRLLLQEAVPGREFRQVFNDLTRDDAGEEDLRRAEALGHAVVEAIRAFQRLPLEIGPRNTFARLYGEQEHNLAYLRLSQPALADQIAALRRELARLEPRSAAAPPVFCHGDFAHGNVIIDGDTVGIVDLDKVGSAEPAYDVAYFLTHMWSFGVRHPARKSHVARLWRSFRDAYLGLAPEVTAQRLALYEALDFVAYVLRNFRKQSHQSNWMLWAQGQVDAAWERLEEAAGPAGAAP